VYDNGQCRNRTKVILEREKEDPGTYSNNQCVNMKICLEFAKEYLQSYGLL
jgi:hypothetical protein